MYLQISFYIIYWVQYLYLLSILRSYIQKGSDECEVYFVDLMPS